MPKNIDNVIRELQKKHGENVIKKASELPPWMVFPTGLPSMDILLGGGFLFGRTTLIAGVENVGKSSLAMQVGGRAQALHNIPVYYIDVEKTFDWERAKIFGLNPDLTYVVRGELTAENIYETVRDLIRAIKEQDDPRAIIIVDSIAQMVVESLFEKSASNQFGGSARVINQSAQIWQILCDMNQMIILINQLRDAIGSMGEDKDLPGGLAQKYVGATILWLRPGQTLKDGTIPVGFETRYTVKKSKTSAPKSTGSINYYFSTGFDKIEDLSKAAFEAGIFIQTGAWATYGEEKYRKAELVEKLQNDQEFYDKILLEVYTKMNYPIWSGGIVKDVSTEE